MSEVKTAAAPAKVQDQKTAAQKMPPPAFLAPEAAPILTQSRPHVFSDPDAGKLLEQMPPISARLEKLERLNDLCEQRDVITEALEKLQGFTQSPNGGQSVIFRGSNGESTSTQHPVVIAAMVEVAAAKLKAKLAEVEGLIIF